MQGEVTPLQVDGLAFDAGDGEARGGDGDLIGELHRIGSDDPPLEFDFPPGRAGLIRVQPHGVVHEIGGEARIFRGGGQERLEGFHPGVFNLVLELHGHFGQAFLDGHILQQGQFDPGLDRLDVKAQAPIRLENVERQYAFLRDAGLLGIKLGGAFARFGMQPEARFGHDHQLAAVLGRLAQQEPGRLEFFALLHARTPQA